MENNPLNNLNHYMTVSTGLLLLLNLCLLIAVRFGMNWARRAAESDKSPEGEAQWSSARRAIGMMIAIVIVMNGLAVFANHQLRRSVDAVTSTFSDPAEGVASVTP